MLTLDEFETRLYRGRRNDGPALLFDAWFGRSISREVLTATIAGIWSGAEYPLTALGQQTWRELFDEAGYTVDGKLTDRPVGVTRLYRGSVPTLRRRWSWTTDRALAERFAHGYEHGGFLGRMPGTVYVLDCPPTSLLCAINDRQESEYVVDTRGLKVRETS
jgi:hypothetical protein